MSASKSIKDLNSSVSVRSGWRRPILFDGFMIGIRDNKESGVGRSELIKVAKSLTYTVR